MKLADYLRKELIFLRLPSRDRREVIEYLIQRLCQFHKLPYQKEILSDIMKREEIKSIGLGGGLAVPHGRINFVDKVYVVFGRSTKGIPWKAVDGKLVHYVFVVVGPDRLVKEYLNILSQISKILMRHNVKEIIRKAKQSREVIQIIRATGVRHHRR